MEFNEFREKVKEALPDFLTDDLRNAEIKDTAVNKLQGESYSGISVTPEGSRVGVSINLEDAFLDYQTGSQFTAVMNGLADNIVGTLGEQFDLGILADYSAVKDMLTLEVVGKDQNAEILQSVPHRELGDLAAVYRIALGETENGNATVLITNKILRNYGITQDQLHQDALDAAQHTMKYSIRSMDEVLREMAQSMGIEQNQPVMFSSAGSAGHPAEHYTCRCLSAHIFRALYQHVSLVLLYRSFPSHTTPENAFLQSRFPGVFHVPALLPRTVSYVFTPPVFLHTLNNIQHGWK